MLISWLLQHRFGPFFRLVLRASPTIPGSTDPQMETPIMGTVAAHAANNGRVTYTAQIGIRKKDYVVYIAAHGGFFRDAEAVPAVGGRLKALRQYFRRFEAACGLPG